MTDLIWWIVGTAAYVTVGVFVLVLLDELAYSSTRRYIKSPLWLDLVVVLTWPLVLVLFWCLFLLLVVLHGIARRVNY